MAKEIIVPSPGESITQVQLARWFVSEGDAVEKDQEVVEIDSDKASFPVTSPVEGIIHLKAAEGDTLAVGAILAIVEEGVRGGLKKTPRETMKEPLAAPAPPSSDHPVPTVVQEDQPVKITPLAGRIISEEKICRQELSETFPGKKITRKEIGLFMKMKDRPAQRPLTEPIRTEERKKLSTLRIKLAERLVAVKNQTAMLTTFNEVNMQKILEIKDRYNDSFKQKHGTGIGLMSFFTRAVTTALQGFPQINSMLDGEELVIPAYCDISIAVSTPKGLVVPVIRNAEVLSLAEIEHRLRELATKARENKITIDDMKGGTFTITNGGVFGSLMSTPILNPPQSAILGMHKIQERPVAVNGQVVIAPMMYLALSYDHRVIDGKESVGFLVKIKELIEDPLKMLTGGEDPYTLLLDL